MHKKSYAIENKEGAKNLDLPVLESFTITGILNP